MYALIIAALFTSTFALACPDLSGTYAVCRSTTGQLSGASDLVVTQENTDEGTDYLMVSTNDETQEREYGPLIADGKLITAVGTDADTGMQVTTTIISTCGENDVLSKLAVSFGDMKVLDIAVQYFKVGNQLHQVTSGSTMQGPVNDTVICE